MKYSKKKRDIWLALGKGDLSNPRDVFATQNRPNLWDYIFSVVQVLLKKIFFYIYLGIGEKGKVVLL